MIKPGICCRPHLYFPTVSSLAALCVFYVFLDATSIVASAYSTAVLFRNGRPDDDLAIPFVMAKELMNPFGISHKNNLLVAEDTMTGKRIGWAQIRSLGYVGLNADPSRFVDNDDDDDDGGNSFTSRIGIQTYDSIEADTNEYVWDEFERDQTEFPNGLSSLPWSKEYQTASKAANDRSKRRENQFQEELARRPQLWELSSVYVNPKYRNQGIGTGLVKGVLEKQQLPQNKGKGIYALALVRTLPWYEQFGFATVRETNQIPNSLTLEITAGNVITKSIGEELVCIRTVLE